MHYVVATRFNKDTWKQNCDYRDRFNMKGCIYGIPREPNEKKYGNFPLFVLEMNLSEQKIMGIGLVSNKIHLDKRYNIYQDGNYNRYIYKSDYRIDRDELVNDKEGKVFIYVFEKILFKISKRYKKGQGFTKLPSWMCNTKAYDYNSVLVNLFKNKYKLNTESLNNNNNLQTIHK
jgi:hypothetical protein